jgi:hypothetical protein
MLSKFQRNTTDGSSEQRRSKADKEFYLKANLFARWKHLPEFALSVHGGKIQFS